jgi:hypothetical protein
VGGPGWSTASEARSSRRPATVGTDHAQRSSAAPLPPSGAQRAGSRGVARSRGARRSGSQPEGVARPDCTARGANRALLLRSAAGPCESSSAAPLRGRPGGEGHRSRSAAPLCFAAPLRPLQLELRPGAGHLQGLGRWRELDLASASRVSPCSASSGWSVGSSTSGSARRRRTVCGGRAGRVAGGFRAGAGGVGAVKCEQC